MDNYQQPLTHFYMQTNTYIPLNNNTLTQYRYLSSVQMTLRKLCIIFLFTGSFSLCIQAQSLHIQPKRDLYIGGSMLLYSAGNYFLTQQYNSPQQQWQVPLIDQVNQPQFKPERAKISDASFLTTAAGAGLMMFALPKNMQMNYALVLAQNVWITGNLVQTTKVLVGRGRPYLLGTGPIASEGKDNYYSFFSGHSAITATMATTALMGAFRYTNGNQQWGKAAALTTGAMALTTAALRIAAGKHYPSDVVTGMIVGTAVALVNCYIHEKQ